MKRKSAEGSGARLGDILKATTAEQRAWIGAVALAYNDTEYALHIVAGSCLGYIGDPYSVTSRINGTDGLIAVIQEIAEAMSLNTETLVLIQGTINEHGFAYLKKLRDGIIHARLFDSSTGVGLAPGKRGRRKEDVLLSPEALEALYKRLILVDRELDAINTIIRLNRDITIMNLIGAKNETFRSHAEQDIQDATARCQSHQSHRLSLAPFPEFPPEPSQADLVRAWLSDPSPTKTLTIRSNKQ